MTTTTKYATMAALFFIVSFTSHIALGVIAVMFYATCIHFWVAYQVQVEKTPNSIIVSWVEDGKMKRKVIHI